MSLQSPNVPPGNFTLHQSLAFSSHALNRGCIWNTGGDLLRTRTLGLGQRAAASPIQKAENNSRSSGLAICGVDVTRLHLSTWPQLLNDARGKRMAYGQKLERADNRGVPEASRKGRRRLQGLSFAASSSQRCTKRQNSSESSHVSQRR